MTSSPDNSIGRRDFIGAGIAGAAIAAATTANFHRLFAKVA